MAKKIIPPNGDGTAIRGPQLVQPPPPETPAPPPVHGAEISVGESVSPEETTCTQLRALDGVVAALKMAIADATIQIAAIEQQRADLILQIGAANQRHMSAVRAAAAGLGIDPTAADRSWNYDPATCRFTRVR